MHPRRILSAALFLLFVINPLFVSGDIKQLWHSYTQTKNADDRVNYLISIADAMDKANEYDEIDSVLDLSLIHI